MIYSSLPLFLQAHVVIVCNQCLLNRSKETDLKTISREFCPFCSVCTFSVKCLKLLSLFNHIGLCFNLNFYFKGINTIPVYTCGLVLG